MLHKPQWKCCLASPPPLLKAPSRFREWMKARVGICKYSSCCGLPARLWFMTTSVTENGWTLLRKDIAPPHPHPFHSSFLVVMHVRPSVNLHWMVHLGTLCWFIFCQTPSAAWLHTEGAICDKNPGMPYNFNKACSMMESSQVKGKPGFRDPRCECGSAQLWQGLTLAFCLMVKVRNNDVKSGTAKVKHENHVGERQANWVTKVVLTCIGKIKGGNYTGRNTNDLRH